MSSSITTIRDGAQPSAAARSTNAYCIFADSVFSLTCRNVDWRRNSRRRNY